MKKTVTFILAAVAGFAVVWQAINLLSGEHPAGTIMTGSWQQVLEPEENPATAPEPLKRQVDMDDIWLEDDLSCEGQRFHFKQRTRVLLDYVINPGCRVIIEGRIRAVYERHEDDRKWVPYVDYRVHEQRIDSNR